MKRTYLWLLVLLIPAALLLPFSGQFAFTSYSSYSDLAISHYPNAVFLLRSLKEYHQLPLWSSTILSGYPFAANPLSGLWYLPGWFALLFPLPLGLNLTAILHMLFGGFGMALFLRDQKLDWSAATAGGLVFETLPRYFGHFASGHLTFVYAIAWTPWLLYAASQAGKRQSGKRISWYQGIILSLILLADIRWAAYAGLLWAAYRLFLALNGEKSPFRNLIRVGWDSSCQVCLAALLAAPLLLPLIEYIQLSTRGLMRPEDTLFLSLPPARLFGLIIPSLDGNTEFTVYSGAFAIVSFLWIALYKRKDSTVRFWIWTAAASLLLTLGSFLPGIQYLVQIPGFQLLRVPSRFVLIAGCSFAVIAAHMVQGFLEEESLKRKEAFFSRLGVAGVMGFTQLAVLGIGVLGGTTSLNLIWGAAACCLAGCFIFLRDRKLVSSQVWIGGVFLLLLLDAPGINSLNVYFRKPEIVLNQGQDAAAYLHMQEGPFRVFSPSYSIPQQTAAVQGLELANGVDPLQLSAYARFIENASGVPSKGYDVVLPSLGNADHCCDNQAYLPEPQALGLLNIKYYAAEFDLSVPGLEKVARFGETRVYENQQVWPRAWVQPEDAAAREKISPVGDLILKSNTVQMSATGPGVVVLSEILYPGWHVTVDGVEERIIPIYGLLRGVAIGSGQHAIQFAFYPRSVQIGVSLCILGWVLLVGYTFLTRERRS
jgi:hypothetical protein